MRIILVYPPTGAEVPVKSTLLGLGYIANVLRNAGHDVEIKDLALHKGIINIDFGKTIPDVVGLSIMFSEYKTEAYNFACQLKEKFPLVHIISGGAHASTFPEEVLEYSDTVVVGEGEEIIDIIVRNKLRGIIRAERIKNLDNLPMPAWDLMKKDLDEINRRHKNSPFNMRLPMAHIITSRGCVNSCTFCSVKLAWGRQWVSRSAKNVVDEIEWLVNNFGIKEIHFNDDNCSIDKGRMYAICDEILSRALKIKIACPTGIHIGTLDRPLLKQMKRAGFYRLCFGIETGNEEMQKKIKKNLNLKKARQVIEDANDLGFWTSATFIFDFPGETEQQVKDTLDFCKTSGLDFPIFYNLNPQPKTEIYEECKRIL